MPNVLDANGLTVKSTTEIVADLTAAYQAIYGPDINVGPNSPDGQVIGILAQALQDNLQLILQVYNSFGIDSAFGVVLDQRATISGIIRDQGTFTLAYVAVTATGALTLPGQDVLLTDPGAQVFTVADTAGNQFQLQTSFSFGGAGTQSLAFEAVTLGQIQTTPNTIQTVITVTPGISGVNNPTTSSDVEGLPEETDPQLKIRQAKSFFLPAQAPADAVRAALLQVPNVSDAYVVENDANTVIDTVPAHGLWIIVNGGSAANVGTAIYKKKNAGCALKGTQTYVVPRPQGNTFTAQWDLPLTQALTIRATLVPRIPGQTFDVAGDTVKLASALVYKLGQSPNSGDVVIAMQVIEPLAILTIVNVSKDGGSTWEDIVSPNTAQYYFTVAAANITLVNA